MYSIGDVVKVEEPKKKAPDKYEDFKTERHDSKAIAFGSASDETKSELGHLTSAALSKEDTVLKKMAEISGADGKPTVVSSAEFEAMRSKSKGVMFRGVVEDSMAEQFIDGDLFAGTGIFGNGTYTAHTPKVSDFSALATNIKEADRYGTNVTQMMLKSDAKVISIAEADKLMFEAANRIVPQTEAKLAAKKFIAGGGDSGEAYDLFEEVNKTLTEIKKAYTADHGRWALSEGYDAIIKKDFNTDVDYLVVLNRQAVIIDEKVYKGADLMDMYEEKL